MSSWEPAAEAPRTAADTADLWLVDLDAAGEPAAETLSAAERERAARLRSPEDARRWAASRRALREVLRRYLGEEPGRVELGLAEHGKPRLATEPAPLEFNLSHSHGLALVGIAAAGQPVGVDLERIVPRRDLLALAERALDPGAVAALAGSPPEQRATAFYAAWTAHEARLKCGGGGLGGPAPPAGIVAHPVEVGDGYAAAFALARCADPDRRLYRLVPR